MYLCTNITEAIHAFLRIILKFQTNLRGLTKSWHNLKMLSLDVTKSLELPVHKLPFRDT